MHTLSLENIELLVHRGQYQQAQQLLNQLSNKNLELDILQARIYEKLTRYDDGLKLINSTIEAASLIDDTKLLIIAMIVKSGILERLGRFEELTDILKEIDLMVPECPFIQVQKHIEWIATYYNIKGLVYWQKGDLETAKHLFEENQELLRSVDKAGLEKIKGDTFNNLGLITYNLYNNEKALPLYEKAIEEYRKIEYHAGIGAVISNLANLYARLGDYNVAEQRYKDSLEIFTRENKKYSRSIVLMSLATLAWIKGDLDHAIALLTESKAYWSSIDNPLQIGRNGARLGELYMKKHEFDTAAACFEEALGYLGKIANDRQIFSVKLNQTELLLERGEIDGAMRKFEQLQSEYSKNSEKLETEGPYLKFIEALIIKQKKNLRNLQHHQDILHELIQRQDSSAQFRIRILLELCDSLLLEYDSIGSVEVLDELEILVDNIEAIALSQNLTPILVKINLIKAEISRLLYQFEEVPKLFDEASKYAMKISSSDLMSKIKLEQEKFQNYVIELAKIGTEKYELGASEIREYLESIKKSLES